MITIPDPMRTRVIVAAAALLLVCTVVAVGVNASGSDPEAGDNLAFASAGSTDEAIQAGTAAARRIFTIRPDKVKATERRARRLLEGDAVDQYDRLYGPHLKRARQQGLTLTTTVRDVGVVWLRSDEAELLVFADQAASTTSGQSAVGPAQLVLRLRRADEGWKVSDIRLL